MGRTKTFDEASVLRKLMIAFWRQGYTQTSIKDLEAATGLSSGSLYNSYGGKQALFEVVLLHYMETVVEPRIKRCFQDDPVSGWRQYLHETIGNTSDKTFLGCLVLNAHIHAHTLPPSVQKLILYCQARIDSALGDAIARMDQSHLRLDPHTLARSVNLLISGSLIRRHLKQNMPENDDIEIILDALLN